MPHDRHQGIQPAAMSRSPGDVQAGGNGIPGSERAQVSEHKNTSSVRLSVHDELIGRMLRELPHVCVLPVPEEFLGRAKNMDPTLCRVHAGRVQEPRAGSKKTPGEGAS